MKFSSTSALVGSVTYTVKNTGKNAYTFRDQLEEDGHGQARQEREADRELLRRRGKFTWTVTQSGSSKKRTGTFTVKNPGDPANGKRLFVSAGCGSCHTLKAAGTKGTSGTNLDKTKPSYQEERRHDHEGSAGAWLLSRKAWPPTAQIQDIAAFIDQSTAASRGPSLRRRVDSDSGNPRKPLARRAS